MKLPEIFNYSQGHCRGNYGTHTLGFTVGSLTVYFSYQTPVAFRVYGPDRFGLFVRVNDWNTTTGKHLDWINPDHKERIPGVQFEAMLAKELAKREPSGLGGIVIERLNNAIRG
mgnify:CR=1 FL=1